MRIHKEGHAILLILVLILALVNGLLFVYLPQVFPWICLGSILLFLLVLQFFRHPVREIQIPDNNLIYAPADGKVVVIEETEEVEYFRDKRLQISIFMSPTNVHVNRNPVSGKVNYFKYHPGKYLVAWHPKSSEKNERTTIVLQTEKTEVLIRQIAGAMARRIKNYLETGEEVKQGSEMGFIKFGSRVDLFLPLTAKVDVMIGQKVRANRSIIARLK